MNKKDLLDKKKFYFLIKQNLSAHITVPHKIIMCYGTFKERDSRYCMEYFNILSNHS